MNRADGVYPGEVDRLLLEPVQWFAHRVQIAAV